MKLIRIALILAGVGVVAIASWAVIDTAFHATGDYEFCTSCHAYAPIAAAYREDLHGGNNKVGFRAACNDCHLRHDFVGKWVTKADNGFFHSLAFTTGSFPDPIQIKPRNRRVTQDACLGCHAQHVYAVLPAVEDEEALLCVHCHAGVGHAQR